MAEDRTPDPADQPEDDKTPPQDNPPEPYRLGGSGGSGKSPQDLRAATTLATHSKLFLSLPAAI